MLKYLKKEEDIREWNERTKNIAENVNFYVYKHYLDGDIFYIGKGTGLRCLDLRNRSKEWLDFVGNRKDEVLVDIVKVFPFETEAFNYELTEIKSSESNKLVNIIHNRKNLGYKNDMTTNKKDYNENEIMTLNVQLISSLKSIKELSCIELNIFLAFLFRASKATNSLNKMVCSYSEIRNSICSLNLQAHKIKKAIQKIKDKTNYIDYREIDKSTFEVDFRIISKDFCAQKEILHKKRKMYTRINKSHFISLRSVYSKILYLHLSKGRDIGKIEIEKLEFLSLFKIPKSYDEYNFIQKALIPAISDNLEFFEDLRLEDFHGRSLPEVCKFSFKKKRAN